MKPRLIPGSRYASDCYLEYVTETVSDDFIYPKTALLAIRALATDQLNGGAPRISAVVTANSDNPSHICRKILEDSGVESLRIMPSFNEWANFCEEKGLKCNIVFDSELSVRKALDTVSLLGRASVLQAGSKFDVIIEKAGLIPAQSFLFGMGNILSDTFKQNFLPLVDRANFIEITYYDKNKDYEPSVVSVGQIAADNSRVSNKSSVTLVGCTDEAQARAYGRFTLNCNRYLTETIEFEADKDSLVCRYGDIIKVSHDTPQYGFSGRLLEDSGADFVILDRDLDTVGGVKYAIQIKNDVNEIKEFEILEILAPNKLRLNLNGNVFRKYDNYAFGEINKASKLYRILKIATSGEFTRHITAIEYNEDIYDDRENISVTDYSSLGVRNLRISEYLKYDTAKNIKTMLALAWSGDSLFYFVTYKSASEERTIKVFNSAFEFEAKEGETYKITVKDGVGKSAGKIYKVLGKLYPPGPVENLKAVELMDDWALSWSYDDSPLDFKEFHIFKDDIFLETTQALNFVTPITGISVIYDIYAVDTSGVKSAFSSVTAIAAGLENVNSVNTFYENDALNIVWGEINSLDRKIGYEIRRGEVWDNSQLIAVTSDTSARIFNSGTYQIAAFYVTNGGAKIMSAMPTTFIVDEANTLEKNGIFKSVEHTGWIGAKNKTTNLGGELVLGTGLFDDTPNLDNAPMFDIPMEFASSGIYDSPNVCTLNAPSSCRITSSLKYSGLNILSDFDVVPNVDELINFDGFKNNTIRVAEEIALSIDGVNFGGYKPFKNGVSYLAKAFKMRLVLSSKDAFNSPIVSEYSYEIDVPDKFESGSEISANNEIGILYKTNFSVAPKVQITILNAVAGDDAILSNQTKGGFMIKIIDKNGIAVVREFNYFAKGY